MSLINLQSILGSSLERKGVAKSITAAMVCEVFDDFVLERFGEDISKKVSAASFVSGVITVKSASSVISQEIKFCEDEIKSTVNEKLGKDVVKKLRFTA